MKKLLLIAALMALGTTALATYEKPCPDCRPDDEVTAQIPVEACLYYPIKIGLQRELDFGAIPVGDGAKVFPTGLDNRSAKALVTGEAGADVEISWDEFVFLRHVKHPSEKIKVVNTVARARGEGSMSNPGVFDIDGIPGYLGQETLYVGGEILDGSTYKKTGKYEGKLNVTLSYK